MEDLKTKRRESNRSVSAAHSPFSTSSKQKLNSSSRSSYRSPRSRKVHQTETARRTALIFTMKIMSSTWT